jgi:hypothetical protein
MRLLEVQPEAVAVSQAFQAASRLNMASNTVWSQQHARVRRPAGDTLKGMKHQLPRPYADPGGHETRDFHRLLRQNLQKASASAFKENFRQLGSHRSVAGAMRFAHDWGAAVANARLRPMITTAETVNRHPRGIAGSVTHPITNAAGEGSPFDVSEPQAQCQRTTEFRIGDNPRAVSSLQTSTQTIQMISPHKFPMGQKFSLNHRTYVKCNSIRASYDRNSKMF